MTLVTEKMFITKAPTLNAIDIIENHRNPQNWVFIKKQGLLVNQEFLKHSTIKNFLNMDYPIL